jgi:hypothetical protein
MQLEFLTVPIKIYELLKTTKKVLIATDGGAILMKGSIGFVIADEDGNILLTCFGQPAGNNPLSFRSEICAFLAVIRLVILLNQYYDDIVQCNTSTPSKIQVYRQSEHDNKVRGIRRISHGAISNGTGLGMGCALSTASSTEVVQNISKNKMGQESSR